MPSMSWSIAGQPNWTPKSTLWTPKSGPLDSKVDALAAETGQRFDQLTGQINKILDLLSN